MPHPLPPTSLLKRLRHRITRGLQFIPELLGPMAQWIEILLIPALACALAWLFAPQDPMLTRALFPWIWFAPTLVSLRYGVMPGLVACVPLIVSWFVADQLLRLPDVFGLEYFFPGALLVLLCGEFSDVWRDRAARLDEANVYLAERLSRITKRHLLLNLSHDRLEHEMLSRPNSLRDALVRLRLLASAAPTGDPVEQAWPGAGELLNLLAQYVNVEAATLYELDTSHSEPRLGPSIRHLGDPEPLLADDALLALALQQRELAHIASADTSLNRETRQLVVAPLLAGSDQLVGVLAVTRMPFVALNVENLQMLSVILGYYADCVRSGPAVHAVQQRLPGLPAQFAEEFARMRSLQGRSGMASHILVMRFDGELRRTIVTEFLRIKRGLDVYWQTEVGNTSIIAVLMPLASPAAMAGFIQRIELWLDQRFQGSLETLGVQLRPIDFADEDPLGALVQALGTPSP